MQKLKFLPEISFGHVVQMIVVVIPAIAFWVKIESRVASLEADNLEFKQSIKDFNKTVGITVQNQAIISALFDQHVKDQNKRDEELMRNSTHKP